MKKVKIIAGLFIFWGIILFSCSHDKAAYIEIAISFLNNNDAWQRDAGAKAFLFDNTKTQGVNLDSMTVLDARSGRLLANTGRYLDLLPLYQAQAPNHGKIKLEVEPGFYLIVLVSNGQESFAHKHLNVRNGESVQLEKRFNGMSDNKKGGEIW